MQHRQHGEIHNKQQLGSVRLLIREKAESSIIYDEVEALSPRVMKATFSGNPTNEHFK